MSHRNLNRTQTCLRVSVRLFHGVVFLIVILMITACGYSFQGSGSILPVDVKKVYIPLAENNTAERGLSVLVTEALRDRFDRFGVVLVTDDESEADAVLKTRIVKVKRGSRAVSSNTDTVKSLDTSLILAAELRRVTGPILWRNPDLEVSRAFSTTSGEVISTSADFVGGTLSASQLGGLGSKEIGRREEKEALRLLAEEAARKIYDESVAPDF